MARQGWIDPEDLRLLLLNVRFLNRWSQEQLAAAAGVDLATISRYENGRVPRRRDAARIFAAAGYPLHWLEATLLPALRALRRGRQERPAPRIPAEPASGFVARLAGLLQGAQAGLVAGIAGDGGDAPAAEARRAAEELWALLAPCSDAERQTLVERWPAYWSWSAVERLCWESEREAAGDADKALALAELALRAAERSLPEGARRARISAYARAYLGNALRVKNDHAGARQEFERAWELWGQGVAATLPLEEWRLWDLEASLLIDSRRPEPALEKLEQALALAPEEQTASLLFQRSNAWTALDEHEKALADLEEAAARIDETWEPRSVLVLQFNRADSLRRLERFEEASRLLPEVRSRVNELGQELDLVRTLWLEGVVAAGLGRVEESLAALNQVEAEFRRRGMAYDGALVNLDTAEIELAQGKTAEVKARAVAMWWVFRGQGIHREALAALQLFCEAAREEVATVELARRVKDYLENARQDPELRFAR